MDWEDIYRVLKDQLFCSMERIAKATSRTVQCKLARELPRYLNKSSPEENEVIMTNEGAFCDYASLVTQEAVMAAAEIMRSEYEHVVNNIFVHFTSKRSACKETIDELKQLLEASGKEMQLVQMHDSCKDEPQTGSGTICSGLVNTVGDAGDRGVESGSEAQQFTSGPASDTDIQEEQDPALSDSKITSSHSPLIDPSSVSSDTRGSLQNPEEMETDQKNCRSEDKGPSEEPFHAVETMVHVGLSHSELTAADHNSLKDDGAEPQQISVYTKQQDTQLNLTGNLDKEVRPKSLDAKAGVFFNLKDKAFERGLFPNINVKLMRDCVDGDLSNIIASKHKGLPVSTQQNCGPSGGNGIDEHQICTGSTQPSTNFKMLNFKLKSHTGEGTNRCSECGKMFCTTATLKIHKTIHTGEKPYECGDCGKTFRWPVSLKIHQRTHTGEKPYGCDQCGKTFRHYNTFRNHSKVHAREEP
ncbi:zinc finger protein 283-like [Polypterus senegalus]|uniref:zinc finger protein 283-like n=1 Tax=Polypterus senegalus TaxID=55291 RepID=UPI001966C6D8|nr:zinc finger protein 283-like [Polypterus senegalus]